MKILYMGTPDFGVPTLQALIDSDHEVVGVVTQPDRPKGRGQLIQSSPVKKVAIEAGLDIFQPENSCHERFVQKTRDLLPDFIVVAAYGQILSAEFLKVPKYFCMNLHASLLPKYRGAAPINWAIINGERQTGITTMKMDKGLDTGEILLKQSVPIKNSDNSQTLHDKLAAIGAPLVLGTIETFIAGRLKFISQNSKESTYAPKINKEKCLISWDQSAKNIHNLVRGLTPFIRPHTFFQGKRLVLSKTEIGGEQVDGVPGEIVRIIDHGIEVATGCGGLIITELKPEGKRFMATKHFIQGHRVETGYRFDPWPVAKSFV